MNYIIVLLLAWILGLCRLSFMNNTKSFFDFIYLKVALCPLWPKNKANPFQTHPNPFFHTPIPVFGRISRIFDNFRKTFLCKANPIYYSESLQQEVPNLYDYTKLQSFFEFIFHLTNIKCFYTIGRMEKLSIVVPVYNEQATLAECVRRVLAVELSLEKELVLVDDASTDETAKVIEQVCRQNEQCSIKVVTHQQNQGKGAALRSGFAEVSGDIVIIQDADLEYDPNDYHRLLKPILDGRADVVYGSRFVGSAEKRVIYFWHYVGNKLLTTLSDMCTNLNFTDMETCYKVFRREVVEKLNIKCDRFGVEPEMTAKIARAGWRIYEVGISYSGRTYAEGKKITWKDGIKAILTIIRFRFFK